MRIDKTKRRINEFKEFNRILIVCEGEKTEPNYFRSFEYPKKLLIVKGAGCETLNVVEEAVKSLAKYKRDGIVVDEIWCVFDRDDFPEDRFYRAMSLAEKYGFHVAYSIEAFEIWYLLHFHFYNTGVSRNNHKKKLSVLIGKEYKKNDEAIYMLLEGKIDDAIKNAGRLRAVQERDQKDFKRSRIST